MANKPILRLPSPKISKRHKGSPSRPPKISTPGFFAQGVRFQSTFDRLTKALKENNPELVLRSDPSGISPERALVFVTAGSIQNFARAAKKIGLEVFSELDLERTDSFPEGFSSSAEDKTLPRTLYATMPTLSVFEKISALWATYQQGTKAPKGAAPWWSAFNMLLELRPWGPEDRLPESSRATIEDRLPFKDDDDVFIELEIWPTVNTIKRTNWTQVAMQRISELGGKTLDRSSIVSSDFIYEAILASLPAHAVRKMLDDPQGSSGLATVEGIQFILPQTIGQALPTYTEGQSNDNHVHDAEFDITAPLRVALFDGTPVAGHVSLNGGVEMEDINDLVRLSTTKQRSHATAMASLILRGDLEADGSPLKDTRLISIPLLIDSDNGAFTPRNKLFVELVHNALTQLISGTDPLARDVFVINFSIGISDMRFAGKISALARLIDWWAMKEGLLFVISAGNITEPLTLANTSSIEFEDFDDLNQRNIVRANMRSQMYERTLLAPAEALNGITVGALSKDLNGHAATAQSGIISLYGTSDGMPQLTSALGLGPGRAIKPDLLQAGGRQEVRALPSSEDTRLQTVNSQRTGLVVASSVGGSKVTQRSHGTSHAAALTTRSILQAAEALTTNGGPYSGQELPRKTLSLLCRALVLNAARWSDDAQNFYGEEKINFGATRTAQAKQEVCRYFGYGEINTNLAILSPENGVTMVGFGSICKDEAQVFQMPLPPSMSGDRIPRSMQITITWFSPVNPARAQYRLASLEAISSADVNDTADKKWVINLKSDGPDAHMIKRGSVWSKRMIQNSKLTPTFSEEATIPICVQCRDTSNGGLSPDDDIQFAIAITLEVEAEVKYDIHSEVEQKIRIHLQQGTLN